MKKSLNYIAGTFLVILGLVAIMQIAMGFLGGKDPQTPYAEKTWQTASYNLCVAEQALSNAKLADYLDGFMDLSDEDIIRLKNKKESECSFQ